MSKNIFSVLDQPGDIEETQTPKRKLSKKEQRKQDKLMREAYGTSTNKEDHKDVKKIVHPHKGKREFERHSGTGK